MAKNYEISVYFSANVISALSRTALNYEFQNALLRWSPNEGLY